MRKEHAVEEEISLLRFKYHVLDFYGVVLKIEMDFDRPFWGGIWYQSGNRRDVLLLRLKPERPVDVF